MKLLLTSLALFIFTSCSISNLTTDAPSQLDIEVKHADKIYIDPELDKQSRGFYHFLLGQLEYKKQHFPEALKNFSQASELSDAPVPFLHTRLAELFLRTGKLEEAMEESAKSLQAEPKNSYALLLHAGILEALQRNEEAKKLYEDLTAQDPDLVEAHLLLANLYQKSNDIKKSVTLLTSFLERRPHEPLAVYSLGRAFELDGNLDRAAQHYQKAWDLDSDNNDSGIALARILIKQNKIENAKEVCAKIINKNTSHPLAQQLLSLILVGENRLDEALKSLEILKESEGNSSNLRFQIALIQIQKRNLREAQRELNLILATEPEHEEARYHLASVLAGMGRIKEAAVELLRIKSSQSLFVKSRTYAAFLLRQNGDLKEAENAIREALKQDKDNKDVLSYLILILRDAKRYDEVLKLIEKELKNAGENERLLFTYGVVLSDMGRDKEANLVMEQVVSLNPEQSDALNYLAYSLAESGKDLDKAFALITRAIEVRPNDGYYLDTLGWIYFQMGRYNEAEEVLLRAVNLTGDDIEVLIHHAEALLKIGDITKAREAMLKGLEKVSSSEGKDENMQLREKIEQRLKEIDNRPSSSGVEDVSS